MRAFFALLLLMSLLVVPLGCGGGADTGTEPEPDVSSPESLAEELPPPGEGGTGP